jgi:quinol monooxygenase YgiN
MGRIVIVLYRPKPGKEKVLLEIVKEHVPILRREKLATARKAIVGRATDGTIVEIFEWTSREAIQEAHSNKVVGELWERFGEVCDFEIPVNVKEFQNLFSEFEPIDVD